jgi:hypothetical protein
VPNARRQLFAGDEVGCHCCCREWHLLLGAHGRSQGVRTGEGTGIGDPYGCWMFWRISKARHSSAS